MYHLKFINQTNNDEHTVACDQYTIKHVYEELHVHKAVVTCVLGMSESSHYMDESNPDMYSSLFVMNYYTGEIIDKLVLPPKPEPAPSRVPILETALPVMLELMRCGTKTSTPDNIEYFEPHFSWLFAIGPDHTAELIMAESSLEEFNRLMGAEE